MRLPWPTPKHCRNTAAIADTIPITSICDYRVTSARGGRSSAFSVQLSDAFGVISARPTRVLRQINAGTPLVGAPALVLADDVPCRVRILAPTSAVLAIALRKAERADVVIRYGSQGERVASRKLVTAEPQFPQVAELSEFGRYLAAQLVVAEV